MMRTVYLIAGEASGDALGAGLMHELSARLGDDVRFLGVGGEKMEQEGLHSLFPYHELSLMGFAEILPHLQHLVARVRQVAEDITVKRPDVVITIDSPGFNFRVMERLRKHANVEGIRFIHYVAPSVWAYKPKRAAKCARLYNHLLTLLPFEAPYFEKEGLSTTFVGHPVAFLPNGDAAAFRAQYNLDADTPLICLMPGSRMGEIKRHLEIFGASVALLAATHPNIAMAVPIPARLLPAVAPFFEGCPSRVILVTDEDGKRNAIAAATCALVKSGTVSLEVAQGGCAQVVAYRANPISMFLIRRMVKIRFANLVNLILNREVIPEMIQERCIPGTLATALSDLLVNPARREAQTSQAAQALAQMRAPGGHPHALAAEAVMKVLGKRPEA